MIRNCAGLRIKRFHGYSEKNSVGQFIELEEFSFSGIEYFGCENFISLMLYKKFSQPKYSLNFGEQSFFRQTFENAAFINKINRAGFNVISRAADFDFFLTPHFGENLAALQNLLN